MISKTVELVARSRTGCFYRMYRELRIHCLNTCALKVLEVTEVTEVLKVLKVLKVQEVLKVLRILEVTEVSKILIILEVVEVTEVLRVSQVCVCKLMSGTIDERRIVVVDRQLVRFCSIHVSLAVVPVDVVRYIVKYITRS